MYLYKIYLIGHDYDEYQPASQYFICHEKCFSKEEYIEHIKKCLPELVEFAKKLPFIQNGKTKQHKIDMINMLSNYNDELDEKEILIWDEKFRWCPDYILYLQGLLCEKFGYTKINQVFTHTVSKRKIEYETDQVSLEIIKILGETK